MNTETQNAYRSLASHFYATRLPDIPVSELNEFSIVGALLRAAPEYRPDYFRRLRNALALDQKLRNHFWIAQEINRTLKPQHLDRFYTQAAWILQWEKLDFVEHPESEESLLNMCVLHLAWSYCTEEKHDLRVPDIKDCDLVNGRAIESDEQVPLTRIMYQQRQLNTMLNSHQHYELNPKKLEIYTKCNRDGRRQLMHYIRQT